MGFRLREKQSIRSSFHPRSNGLRALGHAQDVHGRDGSVRFRVELHGGNEAEGV